MRILALGLTVICAVSTAAKADSVVLTANRVDSETVALTWSGGAPLYQVFSQGTPENVASSFNLIDQTAGTSYTDTNAYLSTEYYLVTDGHCADPSTCPAGPNECIIPTCTGGNCGYQSVAQGTVTSSQTPGDCQVNECDGMGHIVSVPDNTDVPNDNNPCTLDSCQTGVPSYSPLPDGTSCRLGPGTRCRAASCVPTVAVVKVGDGSGHLSGFSAPVFIDERYEDGSLLSTVSLPTIAAGANQPCTLAGTLTSEGALTRSSDESFVQLGGYAATVGTATVASTSSSVVNRVVCRVDPAGAVDSSTRLNAAFSGSSIRGAASVDGTAFWVSGTSTSSSGGAWYISRGTTGGTHILTNPNDALHVAIYGGQLYGDSTTGMFSNVFTIGSGLPTTTGQTATPLPGLPSTMASPAGYVMFDLNPNVAGLDTLYIADNRTIALGGGVQKWIFNGATWSLATTFTSGLTTGPQGITGYVRQDGNVALFVTTSESTGNRLLSYVDNGVTMNPVPTTISTAAIDTGYRGVAMGAH